MLNGERRRHLGGTQGTQKRYSEPDCTMYKHDHLGGAPLSKIIIANWHLAVY